MMAIIAMMSSKRIRSIQKLTKIVPITISKPLIKVLPGFVIIAPNIIRNNKVSFINSTLFCYHSLRHAILYFIYKKRLSLKERQIQALF